MHSARLCRLLNGTDCGRERRRSTSRLGSGSGSATKDRSIAVRMTVTQVLRSPASTRTGWRSRSSRTSPKRSKTACRWRWGGMRTRGLSRGSGSCPPQRHSTNGTTSHATPHGRSSVSTVFKRASGQQRRVSTYNWTLPEVTHKRTKWADANTVTISHLITSYSAPRSTIQ